MSDTVFSVLRTVYPAINASFPGLVSERHDPDILISEFLYDQPDNLSGPVSAYLCGVEYCGIGNTDAVTLRLQSIDFYLSVMAWPVDCVRLRSVNGGFLVTVKTDASPSLIYQYNKSLQTVPVLLRLSEEFIA